METVRVRLEQDGTMVRILPDGRTVPITPSVDHEKLDATSEEDIARQEAEDDAALMSDVRKSAMISSASMQSIAGRIGKTPMTPGAAARIQGATANSGDGGVAKGSFAVRAQSAAAKNSGSGNSGKK